MSKQNDQTKKRSQKRPDEDKSRTMAEWTIFGISATLLLGLLGYITYEGFFEPKKPPVLKVSIEREKAWKTGDKYYLPVSVTNAGSEVMENVWLHIAAKNADDESSEFEIDFFPAQQTDTRILILGKNPANVSFATRASFELPESN